MSAKINYQRLLDDFIKAQPTRRRLALHSCCGPCSSYVLEYLSQHFDVTLYFYNPNIHPAEEYDHRLSEQLRLCDIMGIPTRECVYDPETYFDAVRGLEGEPEGGARCTKCFELRLDYTARLAKADGFDLMATTLTVSPHKNAPLINEIGAEIAARHGIEWLPSDFKKKNGYKRSIELSKEYELYRQNYCGCTYSIWDKEDNGGQE